MATMQEILEAIERLGSKRAAARALGIPESTLRRNLAKSVDQVKPDLTYPIDVPDSFIVKRNSTAYNKDGDLAGQWIQTIAAPGEKFEALPGHIIKGESALVNPDGKIIAKWIKTKEGAVANGLVEALEKTFERFTGAAPLIPEPKSTMAKLHTLYPITDAHIGMYSWGQETGDDYDVTIATQRYLKAYRSLIGSVAPSRTATFLNMGDFYHANDAKNVTPGHGHLLDVDGRHARVFEAGAEMILEITDLLLQRHEIVELVFLQGNHDPDAINALRVAMRLFYRGHHRVQVDNSPRLAWYKRFGKNLIGATHGHTAKMPDVAGMMACDCPQDWGLTEFRFYLTGHVHHERALEKAGVRAESFQTLASPDAYSAHGPWRSGHSIQAITLHEDEGEIARARVNVLADSHRRI